MSQKTTPKAPSDTDKTFSIGAIAAGALVASIHDVTVSFRHAGKVESTDIRIRQLPFLVTEPLYARLAKGENVAAEWIAQALVDAKGEAFLTTQQVADHFTQSLTRAVFDAVLDIEKPAVDESGKS